MGLRSLLGPLNKYVIPYVVFLRRPAICYSVTKQSSTRSKPQQQPWRRDIQRLSKKQRPQRPHAVLRPSTIKNGNRRNNSSVSSTVLKSSAEKRPISYDLPSWSYRSANPRAAHEASSDCPHTSRLCIEGIGTPHCRLHCSSPHILQSIELEACILAKHC